MLYFSYNDFIDYTENGEINEIIKVEENIAKYEARNGKKMMNKNSIINILRNKLELVNFLNDFFNFFEIDVYENIKYCNNIKSVSDKEKNNIIIFKIQNKEIFFIIKIVENIDVNISYKMFEHSLNIIKKWNIEEKVENKRYPIVIPIVIYIGKENWKNDNCRIYKKINYITYEKNRINFSYNMININKLRMQELRKMKSRIAKELMNLKINIYK